MKFRILHISNPVNIPTNGYGGTERVVYELSRLQANMGHDVSVIAGSPSFIPGVKDMSHTEGHIYDEKTFILRRILSLYGLKTIKKIIECNDFDIIHNHVSEELIPLSRLMKSKVVTTLHCPLSLRKPKPFISTFLFSKFPRSTKFVAISRLSFLEYSRFYYKDLIGYVHNGIDVKKFPFISKPKKHHELELTFLAKLIPEKRPHLCIKIADILHEKGYDVNVNIIGKLDYPQTRYVKSLINQIATRKEYIKLYPNAPLNSVIELVGNSDALLHLSHEIGLVTNCIESLAMGTPVLGFENSTVGEIVEQGLSGFICKNINDLVGKLYLVSGIDRAYCRNSMEIHFSNSQMYEKYLNIYQHLLACKNVTY